jgi:hypothetical protein
MVLEWLTANVDKHQGVGLYWDGGERPGREEAALSRKTFNWDTAGQLFLGNFPSSGQL